jgi:hypothetical protein
MNAYKNEEPKRQHKIMVEWEIQEERIEIDGKDKPRIMRKEYNLSDHEKATYAQHMIAWMDLNPREVRLFDPELLIGENCYLNVVPTANPETGKVGAKIGSIAKLRKNDTKLQPEGPTKTFSFEGKKLPGDDLPKWLVGRMADSEEYRKLLKSEVAGDENPAVANIRAAFADGASSGMQDLPF